MEVVEIPDAFYLVYNNTHEIMYLPDAEEEYSVKIHGVTDSDYSILILSIQNEEKSFQTFTNEITKDDELTFKISVEEHQVQLEEIIEEISEDEKKEGIKIPSYPISSIIAGLILSLAYVIYIRRATLTVS